MATANDLKALIGSGEWVPVVEQDLDAVETLFFPLRPDALFNILILKGTNTGTVEFTTTSKADIELGAFFSIPEAAGTSDFFSGDSFGLTGVKIDITIAPGTGKLIINQYIPKKS